MPPVGGGADAAFAMAIGEMARAIRAQTEANDLQRTGMDSLRSVATQQLKLLQRKQDDQLETRYKLTRPLPTITGKTNMGLIMEWTDFETQAGRNDIPKGKAWWLAFQSVLAPPLLNHLDTFSKDNPGLEMYRSAIASPVCRSLGTGKPWAF